MGPRKSINVQPETMYIFKLQDLPSITRRNEIILMAEHILIADDDEHIGFFVRFKLEKLGYQVTWELNGATALEKIRETLPDLVILDLMMPGLGGYEVLEQLRGQEATRAIPVIMLSAMGQENDIVKAINSGADDYLVKPFRPAELQARVQRLLQKHEVKQTT